jgi:flagellar hook assembly protein FlgD
MLSDQQPPIIGVLRLKSVRRWILLVATVWFGLAVWNVATADTPFDVRINNGPRYFSPDGDGQDDTVFLTYCLTGPANVTVTVADSTATVVRTIEAGVSHNGRSDCPANYVEWDGKSDTGAVLPDDAYTIHVEAVNSAGQTADDSVSAGIDTRIPARIVAPAPNDTLSGNVNWKVAPGLSLDRISLFCNSAVLGTVDTAGTDGLFAGSGDTSACSAGGNSLTAVAYWTDLFGASHGWNTSIPVVINNPPKITIYPFAHRYFSPNGDNQEDSLDIPFCLTKSATISGTVTDSGGVVKRALPPVDLTGNASCGWNSVTWDGQDSSGAVVPDGTYDVHLHAVDGSGQTDDQTVIVGVDARAPGQLTTPAPDSVLSGTVDWRFTPTPGFPVNQVQVYCQGANLGGSTDPDFSGSGDSTLCDSGPETLVANAYWNDPFGYSHGWGSPPLPVTIDNPARVAVYQLYAHQYFSPNGDDQDDTLNVYYCLSRNANVTTTVTDATGATVRTIQDGDKNGNSRCVGWNNVSVWDGKDDSGNVVPDGVYTFRVRAGASEDSAQVGIDTRTPGALTAPAAGQTVSGEIAWTFTPSPGFTVIDLSLHCANSTIVWSGGLSGTADTSSCVSGPNSLVAVVTWTDAFGYWHSWATLGLPVVVENTPQITFSPYAHQYFSPNGDSQDDTLVLQHCVSRDAHVKMTVENSSGTTVRTVSDDDETGNPICNYYSGYTQWDGKDDSGAVVPDGTYTVRVRADAAGRTGFGTVEVGVDSRKPGSVISPRSGDTLAGLASYAFQATPGYPVSQVYANVDTGGSVTVFNASADGVWRTSIYTGSLHSGPAVLHSVVYSVDPFGVAHSWVAPEVPVVIDVTSLPLTVTADPATGPAPLATTLHVTTSDPQARPVHYTASFGDGSPSVSGDIPAPYLDVSLAHSYASPGVYRAIVTATNPAGAASTRSVDVTVVGAANTAPVPALALDTASGVVPLPVVASVGGTDVDGDPLQFTLDFGDGTSATDSLPHNPVAHTYTRAGTYLTRLAVSDGKATSVRTSSVIVGLSSPLAANAGDDVVGTAGTTVHFDGSTSRPSAGIDSYHWTFGDGTNADGINVDHAYTNAGTYTATLVVTAGGQSRQDTAVAVVRPAPVETGLVVAVGVPGVDLMVIDGDGRKYEDQTDPSGAGHIHGLPDGTYTVYAWKSGYRPATTSATVVNDTGSASLTLRPGEVATASLTSTPLTYEQIVAAGINPADPANQNVVEFTVNIEATPVHGLAASGGFPTCPTVDGVVVSCSDKRISFETESYHVSVTNVSVHGQPQLVWLVMPGKASWLKEFFAVQMTVTNLGDPAFVLDHGTASLELPSGLALAPTAAPQSATVSVPDIRGGTSATSTWLVRGDTEGFYTFNASYAGSLEPFGDTVSILAVNEKPLHVWGGSALELTVNVDREATARYPFHAVVGLKNVADVPVYNPTLQLLKEGKENYIYQPRETLAQSAAALAPGETLEHDYILIPTVTGSIDLTKSFVSKTAGNTELPVTFNYLPTTTPPDQAPKITETDLAGKILLTWAPIPGATDYQIFSTTNPTTDFTTPLPHVTPLADENGMKRAVVRDVPKGTQAWYAISPTVNGHPRMSHPLTQGTSLETAPYPTVSVIDQGWHGSPTHTCGKSEVTTEFRIIDPVFDVAGVITDGRVDPDWRPGGHESRVKVTFTGLTGTPKTITVRATNSDQDQGPLWTSVLDTRCARQTAVILATGIQTSLDSDGSTTPHACGSDVDMFTKAVTINACDGDDNDPHGNLTSYLISKGYVAGDRSSRGRTVIEFSYKGASVNCDPDKGPTFVPTSYKKEDTRDNAIWDLGRNHTDAAANYLRSLIAYNDCWKQWRGEELSFTVIGHSQGGYQALALADEAVRQGQDGLISHVVTVDGAIQPQFVIPELQAGDCFVGPDWLKLPADVVQALGLQRFGANLPLSIWLLGAYLFDHDRTADRIHEVQRAGVRVATVTNRYDGCLSEDATINDEADEVRVFDVKYKTSGSDRHSALLKSHGSSTEVPGYPLTSFLDSSGYVPRATVLPPAEARLFATGGQITGRIVDTATGQGNSGGEVVVTGNGNTSYTTADPDGSFSIDNLASGDYRVFVNPLTNRDQGVWLNGTVHVGDGPTDVGDVRGTVMPELTVKLSDNAGKPITDGAAVLTDEAGTEVAIARTDATGTARLTAPSGTYTLAATSPTTHPTTTNITLTAASTTTLTLPNAAVVKAKALDEHNAPIQNVVAALYQGDTAIAAGFTSADGTFTFSGLTEGDYTVRLYEPFDRFDLPQSTQPVHTVIGAPAEVTYVKGATPVITSGAPPQVVQVGSPVDFTFTATGNPAPTFTTGTLPNGLTLAHNGELTGTPTTPGTFTFTVQATNSAGTTLAGPYTMTVEGTTSVPTTTTLTTSAPEVVYGNKVTFTATVNAPNGTFTFTDGDTPICANTTTCQTALTADIHAITATYNGAPGFLPSKATITQKVIPAVLRIDTQDATMTYGGTVPTPTYKITGFVNGDDTNAIIGSPTCLTSTRPAVGTYPITCAKGTLTTANYTFIPGRTGTLTVNKAPLTLKADNRTMVYGDPTPPLTATLEGFVAGDTANVVTGTAQCKATPKQAGTYPITCTKGTLTAKNYTIIDTNPGTLTVTRRPATLTYTGPLYAPAGTVTLQAQAKATAGDLSKAKVDFLLYKSDNVVLDPAAPDLRCPATTTTAGTVTCKLTNVPMDNWTVIVAMAPNDYYTADSADPVVLSVSQTATGQFAAAAGWVNDLQTKGVFGFVVYPKPGGKPAGQAIYVYTGANGYRYIVKTTGVQTLAFGTNTVSFTAECGVTVVRPNGIVTTPNYTCRVDATDNPDPAKRDTFALSVYTAAGVLYHQVGTTLSQLQVLGGSVVVRSR